MANSVLLNLYTHERFIFKTTKSLFGSVLGKGVSMKELRQLLTKSLRIIELINSFGKILLTIFKFPINILFDYQNNTSHYILTIGVYTCYRCLISLPLRIGYAFKIQTLDKIVLTFHSFQGYF